MLTRWLGIAESIVLGLSVRLLSRGSRRRLAWSILHLVLVVLLSIGSGIQRVLHIRDDRLVNRGVEIWKDEVGGCTRLLLLEGGPKRLKWRILWYLQHIAVEHVVSVGSGYVVQHTRQVPNPCPLSFNQVLPPGHETLRNSALDFFGAKFVE